MHLLVMTHSQAPQLSDFRVRDARALLINKNVNKESIVFIKFVAFDINSIT